MSDEKKGAAPPVKKPSGLVKGVVVLLMVLLLPAIGGLATYKFYMLPKLEEVKKENKPKGEAEDQTIPPEASAVALEEAQTAVASSDPTAATSMLVYAVAIVCSNLEAKEIVTKNKEWFVAMLADLHRNKTRADLEDPLVEKSILEQAREQANALLKRFQKKPNPEVRIIQVLHTKYSVFAL